MGAINFGTLTAKTRFALVNETETEEGQDYFFNYDLEETETEIEKGNFYYFNLSIKDGYYQGFYLRLEQVNTKWIYENNEEKKEVIKELEQIKEILIKLVEMGLLWGCFPDWVYNRLTKAETIKEIKANIKQLKEEIKASYTERTAEREKKSLFDIMREKEEKQQQGGRAWKQ